jgi:hypothetical protein
VLSLSLADMIEAFQAIRWKVFEDDEARSLLRAEVPLGFGEAYVVELPYEDPLDREYVIDELVGAGFIQQTTCISPGF